MSDKLSIFNTALGYLRERKIASLSESSEARRVMDTYWTDAVAYCLEQGYWKFALKTEQIYSNSGYSQPFGYTYQFTIPTDWVRTYQMSASDIFVTSLTDEQCIEEAGYWYAYVDPIYVRYISNASDYGNNISLWSASFADYVASRLAKQAAPRLTDNGDLIKWTEDQEKKARIRAKANDAMNGNPAFAHIGSWAKSRRGMWPGDKVRNTLIG